MTEWRPILGWPEYEASDAGEIRRAITYNSTYRGRVLRQRQRSDGYMQVGLSSENKVTRCYVHRLVAIAFYGPPPSPRHAAAHIDGNRSNNAANNLRWATYSENEADKVRHGTLAKGERSGMSRLTEDDVKSIRNLYRRGHTQVDLAATFKTSQSNVSRIVRDEIWR